MAKEKFNKFSVALGLLDYINPIFYSVTIITIIKNIYPILNSPFNLILLIGGIISLFFGFIIPTGKVIVGLGLIKFRMPVSLVFCVNTGILLSGLMLLKYVLSLNFLIPLILLIIIILLLFLLYNRSKKLNTIAVLTGAIGYVMIYTSLITLAIRASSILPIILSALAIIIFVMLCGIGIKANLKDPKVHWIIEISNVVCQFLVMISTLIIFK